MQNSRNFIYPSPERREYTFGRLGNRHRQIQNLVRQEIRKMLEMLLFEFRREDNYVTGLSDQDRKNLEALLHFSLLWSDSEYHRLSILEQLLTIEYQGFNYIAPFSRARPRLEQLFTDTCRYCFELIEFIYNFNQSIWDDYLKKEK